VNGPGSDTRPAPGRSRLRGIAGAIALTLVMALPVAAAQEPGADPGPVVGDLIHRKTNLGLECRNIGYSVPTLDRFPRNPAPGWAAYQSACVPGFRLVMSCLGERIGEDRLIGCTMAVPEGQANVAGSCDRFALLAGETRTAPEPVLTDALASGSPEILPCTANPPMAGNTRVGVAFLVPADVSNSHVAVEVALDGEPAAFIVPSYEIAGGLLAPNPIGGER